MLEYHLYTIVYYTTGGGVKYWGIQVVNEAFEARSGDVIGGEGAELHIHVLPLLIMGETKVTVPELSGRNRANANHRRPKSRGFFRGPYKGP